MEGEKSAFIGSLLSTKQTCLLEKQTCLLEKQTCLLEKQVCLSDYLPVKLVSLSVKSVFNWKHASSDHPCKNSSTLYLFTRVVYKKSGFWLTCVFYIWVLILMNEAYPGSWLDSKLDTWSTWVLQPNTIKTIFFNL